jgi:hypothetical protein
MAKIIYTSRSEAQHVATSINRNREHNDGWVYVVRPAEGGYGLRAHDIYNEEPSQWVPTVTFPESLQVAA